MDTLTGHYYELDLVVSGPMASSSDWLVGPLAEKYPVDVVSVGAPEKATDAWTHAKAVVLWKADPGAINPGDTLSTGLEGVFVSPLGLSASAVVVAVTDLGVELAQGAGGAAINYLLAAALLIGTLYVLGWRRL